VAKTNLFRSGDMVNTQHGKGVIIKNCPDFKYWQVKINNRLKQIHYSEMELI
jgi:hypothetical protein